MSGHALPLTGERTLPGIEHERYWFARHVAAYRFAATFLPADTAAAPPSDGSARATPARSGVRVLDAGCGEGYGTAMLAGHGARAVGVDRAPEVVAHATEAYQTAIFAVADLSALPLPSASAELLVSLQVVEHLPDLPAALREAARVLAPGGRLICSTPNRLTFTPGWDSPINPFHVEEFSASELHAVLGRCFAVECVLGVRHGPRLAAIESEAGRSLPDLLLDSAPDTWPGWLARLVASVTPEDFLVDAADVDGSLDLVAVARGR